MEEKELVRLLEVESDVEANFLKGFFADHGIQAMITGIDSSAFGATLEGPEPIELYVSPDDVENAKELIEELLDNDENEVPAWTCNCGEEVDEGFFVCWSCGAEYTSTDSESETEHQSESE